MDTAWELEQGSWTFNICDTNADKQLLTGKQQEFARWKVSLVTL
jgi:hypothetical protein